MFKIGLFGVAHGCRGGESGAKWVTLLYNLPNTSYNDESMYNNALPKEDLKTYKSRNAPLELC